MSRRKRLFIYGKQDSKELIGTMFTKFADV